MMASLIKRAGVEMVQLLLDRGADVHVRTILGKNCAHVGVLVGVMHQRGIYVIDCGADVDASRVDGAAAAQSRRISWLLLLVARERRAGPHRMVIERV